MWSLPFNANPESSSDAGNWCKDWAEEEDVLDIKGDNVNPCPCTLNQAMADVGHFERDPWCSSNSSEKDNCKYRKTGETPAKHCVRARMPRYVNLLYYHRVYGNLYVLFFSTTSKCIHNFYGHSLYLTLCKYKVSTCSNKQYSKFVQLLKLIMMFHLKFFSSSFQVFQDLKYRVDTFS